jgi:hypothetical protein
MAGIYCKPLKTETITRVLHRVRQNIIRDQIGGQEHVDALLRMYGVEPDTLPTAAKRYRPFKRGELTAIVREALRGGAFGVNEVADHLQTKAPWLSREQALQRVRECLGRLAP